MEDNIKVIGEMIKCMDMDSLDGLVEKFTKVITKKI
jgi:hypothetical protein